MASSLRLPAGSFTLTARSGSVVFKSYATVSQQCRSFSQSSQRWAYRSQNFSPPSIKSPSIKAQSMEALQGQGQLPNDIGLLPGTFVRPLWRNMPSIFENPRDRWMMEWTSVKSFFQNYLRWATLIQSGHVRLVRPWGHLTGEGGGEAQEAGNNYGWKICG